MSDFNDFYTPATPPPPTTTGTGAYVLANNSTINDASYNGSQTSANGTITGVDIDCGTGIFFPYAMAGNATFTLSNIPSGNYSFCLRIAYTSGTANWSNFTNLKWLDNTAPSFTAGRVYRIFFSTNDSGANWEGAFGEYY